MKLTTAQLQQLEARQIANILRKLTTGKSLTLREQELLARHRKPEQPNFVSTWAELATQLGRNRQSLDNWRERFKTEKDFPKQRADRRHDVGAWRKFMIDHDLADEPEPKDNGQLPKSHWDRERARVDFERAVFLLEVQKRKHVELDEICAAIGQMLAGFRTAINMLPGSAARWLIGLKDFHQIKTKLESEVDGVLQSLGRCRYMADLTTAVVDRVLAKRPKKYRNDVKKSVNVVLQEIGRESLKELMEDDFCQPGA